MRELTSNDIALQWVTISRENLLFQLRSDDDVIASMRIEPFSGAWTDTTGHEWHFELDGILRRRIRVTDASTGRDVAAFSYTLPERGVLVKSDGRKFDWHLEVTPLGVLRGRRTFSLGGRPLVTIEFVRSMESLCDGMIEEVEVHPAGAAEPDMLLLISVGWFVISRKVLERKDHDSI